MADRRTSSGKTPVRRTAAAKAKPARKASKAARTTAARKGTAAKGSKTARKTPARKGAARKATRGASRPATAARARKARPRPLALPTITVRGVMRPEDARAAVMGGADAIEVVHVPGSPRRISVAIARRVVAAVEGRAHVVALMSDVSPEEARAWVKETGATALELAGAERPEDWKDFPVPVLRRVAVRPGAEAELEAWRDVAALMVLELPDAAEAPDQRLARALAGQAPCVLAGGLDERNVEDHVKATRVTGVAAGERLEGSPGRPDSVRVGAFVVAAREALGDRAA